MIDQVTSRVLEEVAGGDQVEPLALRFLLRRYRATLRDDLREVLGAALARALDQYAADSGLARRADWLRSFAEAATTSDDDRIREAAGRLLTSVRGCWRSAARPGEAAASVEACLVASRALGDHETPAAAVDELEGIVGRAYTPGEGVLDRAGACSTADQIDTASALLTAYETTARLPYSMLAEELMQTARRHGWDHLGVVEACDAARVLCRLAALHGEAAYVAAAVVAPHADYRGDAERILARQSSCALRSVRGAAAYGLALSEWLVK